MLRQVDEDLVQEAVAEVMLKPEAFQGKSLFSTWFHGMVRNKVKQKLDAQRDEQELGELTGESHSESEGMLWQQLQSKLTKEELVMVLWLREGMTQQEMGKFLGLGQPAVNARVGRLREKVGKLLGRDK